MEQHISIEKKIWNFELFSIASISMILFLSIELFSRIQNLYEVFPYIDIITHFLAGLSLFLMAYWLANIMRDRYKKRLSFLFVFISSVIWEIVETIEEMLVVNPPHLKDIFFWDGFFDIFWALVGAGIGVMYISRYKLKNYFKYKYRDRYV